jgi:amino-acid N-acetyltransferase
MTIRVRPAVTKDVAIIRRMVETYTLDGRLLAKAMVTLYEDVQEFVVALDDDEAVIGCGALHVMWEDLAEVRTLAVDPNHLRRGVGSKLLQHLIEQARTLGVQRVFCLTFETGFFGKHGFAEIDGTPVDHAVFEQLLQSYDVGVAEFLDLERVKPNTLGNHRMLLQL